ncbi:acyl-CoA dehydratase activase [Wukongibacter baidiensis]|uniref:acyl-CoA dehydratase activase n=1 Tax=Wukongibacter baidiensis TaxID=1723361 RepID=UPI003D7F2D42
MYSVGIDSGSVATKAVLFDGKILEKVIIPTGWSPKVAAEQAMNLLLLKRNVHRDDIKKVIGTGYGRVSMSFVDKTVTEITCHGKGAYFLNNNVRTILDIGGQDSKVIRLDSSGNVIDFIMNDKCAAGTGRFLQAMSNVLGFDVIELDDLARDVEPETITSMCTVFAESEVISLLARGVSKEQTASGIVHSIANRGVSILSKINLSDDIAFTGGVAKSEVIKEVIENKIKKSLYVPQDSQIVGALGAAVIGWKIVESGL